jgi:predicted  nucleic acid-binding Zn-ribbon protein
VGIPRLYELQQVDLAIARATAQRAALNDGAPERDAVEQASARLHDLLERLAAARAQLRDLDLQVQSLQQKRAKVEANLYGGRIRNPKELESMHDEGTALDRTRSRLEDDMLALLDEVERLEPQERDARDALEVAKGALTQQTAWFQQAARAADQDIADLAARRARLVGDLEEDLVRRYDRLHERKGGLAIVAARNGICEGCHVAIPAGVVRRLEDDPETLAACDGCGRLLHVPGR